MSKIDEALQAISEIGDTTERALAVAGLVSTLLRIKNIQPVVVGQMAYECYAQAEDTQPPAELQTKTNHLPMLQVREVMSDMLGAKGHLREWDLLDVPVRFSGQCVSQHLEICRDVQTDFGILSLMPVEEIIANLVVAASGTRPDAVCLGRAKRLMVLALSGMFEVDWKKLREIADSEFYRVGERIAELRQQAKAEADASGASMLPDEIGQPPAPNGEAQPMAEQETEPMPPSSDPNLSTATSPLPAPSLEAEPAPVPPPTEAQAAEAAGITQPRTKPRIQSQVADGVPRPAAVSDPEAGVPSTKKKTTKLVPAP